MLKSNIFLFLTDVFSKEIATILMAMLPIFELRLAVPVAIIKFNLPLFKAYGFSILGNMLPVIPLLIFLKYFLHKLENMKLFGKFFKWWLKRVKRKSQAIEKWGFWGLVCFVAIPLPVTGAWTGSAAATMLEMDSKKAFFAIFCGVMIAGIIMSILSLTFKELVNPWIHWVSST